MKKQEQHPVTWLKLLGLGWPVVNPSLFSVWFLLVLFGHWGHLIDPLLHILDVFNDVEWQELFFPHFLGYIQQPSKASSEEEFKHGEACGRLGCFSYGEQDKEQGELQVPSLLVYHPLECLIKNLNQAVGLRVTDRCSEMFDLQQLAEIGY